MVGCCNLPGMGIETETSKVLVQGFSSQICTAQAHAVHGFYSFLSSRTNTCRDGNQEEIFARF